jgi:hypothetical protein
MALSEYVGEDSMTSSGAGERELHSTCQCIWIISLISFHSAGRSNLMSCACVILSRNNDYVALSVREDFVVKTKAFCNHIIDGVKTEIRMKPCHWKTL